jgi:hypothetical protein
MKQYIASNLPIPGDGLLKTKSNTTSNWAMYLYVANLKPNNDVE